VPEQIFCSIMQRRLVFYNLD